MGSDWPSFWTQLIAPTKSAPTATIPTVVEGSFPSGEAQAMEVTSRRLAVKTGTADRSKRGTSEAGPEEWGTGRTVFVDAEWVDRVVRPRQALDGTEGAFDRSCAAFVSKRIPSTRKGANVLCHR